MEKIKKYGEWQLIGLRGSVLSVVLALGLVLASQAAACLRRPTPQSYLRGVASIPVAEGIPFEEDDGHIAFPVRINGSRPLRFGLDTGAIRSVIDVKRAQELGLKMEGGQRVGGAGGRVDGSNIRGVSIGLLGVELRNQTIWALPLGAIAQQGGAGLDGIIGFELFNRYVVDIDYAKRVINLYEPDTYKYQGDGDIVPISIQENDIYVKGSILIKGRAPIEGEFIVDTGSNQSLILSKEFVEQHRIRDTMAETMQGMARGVGGQVAFVLGRTKSFRLGKFEIKDVLTILPSGGEFADAGKAGNVGGRLLRRFHVVFDYRRERMILSPNELFSIQDEADMSGIALSGEGPGFGTIKVDKVKEGSPGALAGLRPGDVIESVDGHPAAQLGLVKVRKGFREDGKVCRLEVRRAGQKLEMTIKLRRQV
jgi:hypothetical protein